MEIEELYNKYNETVLDMDAYTLFGELLLTIRGWNLLMKTIECVVEYQI